MAKTFQPQSGPPSWHSGHIAARKSGRTLPPVTTFETNPRYKLPKTRTHPLWLKFSCNPWTLWSTQNPLISSPASDQKPMDVPGAFTFPTHNSKNQHETQQQPEQKKRCPKIVLKNIFSVPILKWPSAGDLIQGDKPDNACMCLFTLISWHLMGQCK